MGAEGGDGIQAQTAGLFGIVRSLIRGWFAGSCDDADTSSAAFALRLVANFLQWLLPNASPSASQLLSGRCGVFAALQLIQRRALGLLSGITARLCGKAPLLLTTTRLLFCTRSKLSVSAAATFVEYFLNQLSAREEFQFIQFNANQFFSLMIWMDRNNHACIAGAAETAEEPLQNWLIAEHLPPVFTAPFYKIVAAFVRVILNQIGGEDELILEAEEDAELVDEAAMKISLLDDDEEEESSASSSAVKALPFEFTQNFLALLQTLINLTEGAQVNQDAFNQNCVPMRNGKADSFALEFVKMLGAIFSLHSQLATKAVPSLLKQAFSLLGVGEFSDRVIYKSPLGSLKIKNLACQACGFVQNLDLARERDPCCGDASCSRPFEAADLEEALLEHLKSSLLTFMGQDLTCMGCRKPTISALLKTCPTCPNAAKLALSIPKKEVTESIEVARSVAQAHKMLTVSHFITQLGSSYQK